MPAGWFRLAPWTEAKLVNIAEFEKIVQMEYPNAETNLAAEQRVFCFTQDDNSDDDDIIQVSAHEAVIKVAISIGSVIHVIHPDELPAGIRCELDISARHFKGAGVSGSHVENFGSACKRLKDDQTGMVADCSWSLAGGIRPLQLVLKIIGTVEHPKQEVVFYAGTCVVVLAGTVDKLRKFAVTHIMQ